MVEDNGKSGITLTGDRGISISFLEKEKVQNRGRIEQKNRGTEEQ